MDASGAKNQTEVTTFVQGLLTQMRGRFEQMSDNILTKVDSMGVAIDALEKSVAELVEQATPGDTAVKQ